MKALTASQTLAEENSQLTDAIERYEASKKEYEEGFQSLQAQLKQLKVFNVTCYFYLLINLLTYL